MFLAGKCRFVQALAMIPWEGTRQRRCLIEPLRHISSGFLPKRIKEKKNYTNIPWAVEE